MSRQTKFQYYPEIFQVLLRSSSVRLVLVLFHHIGIDNAALGQENPYNTPYWIGIGGQMLTGHERRAGLHRHKQMEEYLRIRNIFLARAQRQLALLVDSEPNYRRLYFLAALRIAQAILSLRL